MLSGIEKSYMQGEASVPVLRDVQLEVASGEFIAVVGSSGSGKSTLLNILGFLDTPDSGRYMFQNVPVDTFSQKRLAEIRSQSVGFVFQMFNLIPRATILSNVELPLVYQGLPGRQRRDRAMRALDSVGLMHRAEAMPNQISGGEQQRVAIARAMVTDPDLIIADEPTGNLDSRTAGEVMRLLIKLHKEGKTLIIVTHEAVIADYAQRTLFIHDGRIRESIGNAPLADIEYD